MPGAAPAFDLQSYVDSLFSETATVPEPPPLTFFYPPEVVVNSSGVPGVSKVAPELLTKSTKPGVGGGGESITASALDILRLQQLAKQRFDAAANVGVPPTQDTRTANRIAEMRQKVDAQQLIAAARSRQVATREIAALRTRNAQEAAARAASSVGDSYLPVIISDGLGLRFSDSTVSTTITAGQDILYMDDPGPEYYPQPVDFGPIYSESFVISGGMDSPGFASEDEQPSGITVHERTAAYDIGF
jgi:hypothetical protein